MVKMPAYSYHASDAGFSTVIFSVMIMQGEHMAQNNKIVLGLMIP